MLRPFKDGWGRRLTFGVGLVGVVLVIVSPLPYVWVRHSEGVYDAGPIVVAIYALLFLSYTYGN